MIQRMAAPLAAIPVAQHPALLRWALALLSSWGVGVDSAARILGIEAQALEGKRAAGVVLTAEQQHRIVLLEGFELSINCLFGTAENRQRFPSLTTPFLGPPDRSLLSVLHQGAIAEWQAALTHLRGMAVSPW